MSAVGHIPEAQEALRGQLIARTEERNAANATIAELVAALRYLTDAWELKTEEERDAGFQIGVRKARAALAKVGAK